MKAILLASILKRNENMQWYWNMLSILYIFNALREIYGAVDAV